MTTLEQLSASLTGRYEVEREIGRGGMATVYLARDPRHNRKVAIKLLDPELGAVLGVERFLAEIQVTANLQHPNLLPLFDSGKANGLLFYVMPYVEGESLRARLEREKQLPVEEALRIAVAVASALDYAHGHGVIHRDLKPENILLQSGQPVVADFGIALAVSNAGGSRVTQTGLSLGTPQYMSPEQATGDRVIDGRADIYSLAAVTYEMLGGEPPHTGNTMQAIIARVLTEHPRSVRSIRPSVPEHVELALERALEKLPADRWPTAREFAEALQGRSTATLRTRSARAMAGGPVRSVWRARLADPVVLVLAAATLGASLFGVMMWSGVRRPPTSQPTVRFPLTLPRDVQFAPTTQQALAISGDGGLIAFVGRGASGVPQLYIRAADDPEARPVPGTEGAFSVFFSPDGKWLGFMANGKVRKVAIGPGAVLPVIDVGAVYNGATWSARGEIVVSTGLGRLMVVSENGGTPRRACPSDTTGVVYEGSPLVLPDGEWVLYSSWPAQSAVTGRLAIASLATGRCKVFDVSALQPLGVVAGHVLYVTSTGTLTAAAFDLDRQLITSSPVPLLTEIEVHPTSGAAQAALSDSGTLIHQVGAVPNQVVLADLAGVAKPLIDDIETYAYPRFSPDGRKIAITVISSGQRDVWIYDIPSRTSTKLTTDGDVNERAEWTPDGKRVLYRAAKGQRADLWWRAADLSEPERPLLRSDRDDFFEGVITPDGNSLVYQIDTDGANVMYRSLTGDSTPKPIANSIFVETQARVSPDGKWVTYVTTESGSDQVVVQPFPGPGARIQVSIGGGREPVWSRDGRRLFYRDNQSLIAASISTNPAFAVTARQVLFADTFMQAPYHANFDASPDGLHLLLLKATEEAQVMVVYNWANEVRQRLSARTVR